MNKLIWNSKKVKVASIDPTPVNYKIKTELGRERLRASLSKFGIAGTVICNRGSGGRYTLIDGNSRVEEARANKVKVIEVSVPNRSLTLKEFKEMSAMLDFAKAGEVDIERIEKDLGKTKDFYKAWGLDVPLHLVADIGRGSSVGTVIPETKRSAKDQKAVKEVQQSEMRLVQLTFTEKEEREFRTIEAKLIKLWGTSSTMETTLKAMRDAVRRGKS